MKTSEQLDTIINLSKTALTNPDVKNDLQLYTILLNIYQAALNGEIYYDDKREFLPIVSQFTMANNFCAPNELVKLLAFIKTPRSWFAL